MLWQRVLTSFALLGLILFAVFGLSAELFCVFILLVMGLAIWEWSALTGINSIPARIIYLISLVALMIFSATGIMPANIIFYGGAIFWLVAFMLVYAYPSGQNIWGSRLVLAFFGVPLFIPGWLAFYTLRNLEFHEFYILFLFFLVAAADIGAYFSGRAFGKYKLAVSVSPNKTWEGFAGGVAGCTVLTISAAVIFSDHLPAPGIVLLLKLMISAVVIASFSVIGDLFESMVKRFRDVKDSGAILPGHGGILDRIDGLTAAAPIYAIIILLPGVEIL